MTPIDEDPRPRLLVLGASRLQSPALVKGRELGYRVGVVDRDPDAVGIALADDFFEISTTDVDAIVEAARGYRPAGVLTLGTDMPMRGVAGVADALGLVGPSPEATRAATDKGEMAEAFAHGGVPAPRFAVVASADELAGATSGWDLPYILKPVDNAGSRGVVLVETSQAAAEAFRYSHAASRSGRVIAQEYLRGREVSVEGFLLGDELHVVTITDKLTSAAPHFVEMGHSQPSSLPDSDQAAIRALTAAAARALGVTDCAVHAEIMLTLAGPRMIEFGARLGGDFITTDLVPLSTGVDMVTALIDLSCGHRPDLTPTRSAASAIRFLTASDPGPDVDAAVETARHLEGVADVHVLQGGCASAVHSSADRAGQVIAVGDTPDAAIATCETVLGLIRGEKPRSILVLGAGRGQVGLIRAAKQIGARVLVASLPSTTAPGIPLADAVLHVDITDVEGIERIAREEGVDAIATSCADTGLPALGRACDALGLPGLSEQAALICADKKLMKEAFAEGGVRSAQYATVRDLDGLNAALERLSLPVIIKATDLQGSKGIVIIRDADELESGFRHVMEETTRDEVIVEEFIEGVEFGAQALVHEGRILFTLLHNDDVHLAKTAVPVLHSVPIDRDEAFRQRAEAEIARAIRATGLDNCAVNVDLIARGDEVFIIELTGRVGANGLPEMVSRHFGIDYYETLARLALGESPVGPWDEPGQRPAVVVRMVIEPNLRGVVRGIDVNRDAVPEAEYLFFRRPGDEIDGFEHSGDCVGQITVAADTLPAANELALRARQAITIDLE
ncbi:ATP-grasp domain-containing protein [Tessaracoccus oleiagri]|uniref:Biotin carboxylase n=1 Tax=Tessaracoccus oleiagri TaxID=686624 RepID=A0A1G9KFX8_9ACTN|nr:ATP-grasp domain-containing protein [Tessaracoccus oleiagri]SDL48522.1 Biotin carboxylase [Tessaracoccus oleiagri]